LRAEGGGREREEEQEGLHGITLARPKAGTGNAKGGTQRTRRLRGGRRGKINGNGMVGPLTAKQLSAESLRRVGSVLVS
jgi:hypothetical protein